MVEETKAPDSFDKQSAVVFPEAISVAEHDALVAHVEPLLKRYALCFVLFLFLI
jgi:hypothetical protein